MMIRTVVQFVSICVMSLFAASVFGADLGGFKNYSADMETITPQGSQISKIFSKDGKTRMESGMRGSGIISIIRPDKKVVWMVMVDGKAYMEMPFDKSKNDIQSKLHDPNAKVDKEFIGNDVVDKHPTKKYHVTVTAEGKKEKSGYIWEAADLNNFPVKYESEDKKITTIWKNIKTGGVDDSVFELPAGYKKVDMPVMPGMGDGSRKQKR